MKKFSDRLPWQELSSLVLHLDAAPPFFFSHSMLLKPGNKNVSQVVRNGMSFD